MDTIVEELLQKCDGVIRMHRINQSTQHITMLSLLERLEDGRIGLRATKDLVEPMSLLILRYEHHIVILSDWNGLKEARVRHATLTPLWIATVH